MAHTSLLVLQIRRKRDALHARGQARRVAALLGFEPREQACLAGLVFELACRTLDRAGSVRLEFTAERGRLVVAPVGVGTGLRVEKTLPRCDPAVAAEDLPLVVRELALRAPASLFEEVQKQNQELLRVLVELRECQARLAELTRQQAA